MGETCKQMDCELLEFGGEDGDVHLMVAVRHKQWGNHFWSPSYCLVSSGGASLDVVKAYIEQQQIPPSEKSVKQSMALRKVNQNMLCNQHPLDHCLKTVDYTSISSMLNVRYSDWLTTTE